MLQKEQILTADTFTTKNGQLKKHQVQGAPVIWGRSKANKIRSFEWPGSFLSSANRGTLDF